MFFVLLPIHRFVQHLLPRKRSSNYIITFFFLCRQDATLRSGLKAERHNYVTGRFPAQWPSISTWPTPPVEHCQLSTAAFFHIYITEEWDGDRLVYQRALVNVPEDRIHRTGRLGIYGILLRNVWFPYAYLLHFQSSYQLPTLLISTSQRKPEL